NASELRALSQRIEQEPCDGRTADVVAALLASTFEGLGGSPADPAVGDVAAEAAARRFFSAAAAIETLSHDAPPAEKHDVAGGNEKCASVAEDMESAGEENEDDGMEGSEEEEESGDGVDVEFWRRLCS
ncbi:hypothetical protein DQ04_01391110, partial [Trypanosoma grayi]|uniref:hypothetical protein n=1 Tax=Trypanosoma grayi TaxID=71804 RepID=UPI0004F432F1